MKPWLPIDTQRWVIQQWMAVKDQPPIPLKITVEDIATHAVVKMNVAKARSRRAGQRPPPANRNIEGSDAPTSD
jgi:hypothetical protein